MEVLCVTFLLTIPFNSLREFIKILPSHPCDLITYPQMSERGTRSLFLSIKILGSFFCDVILVCFSRFLVLPMTSRLFETLKKKTVVTHCRLRIDSDVLVRISEAKKVQNFFLFLALQQHD